MALCGRKHWAVFTKPQTHYTDQFPEPLKSASQKGIVVILIFPNQEIDGRRE